MPIRGTERQKPNGRPVGNGLAELPRKRGLEGKGVKRIEEHSRQSFCGCVLTPNQKTVEKTEVEKEEKDGGGGETNNFRRRVGSAGNFTKGD